MERAVIKGDDMMEIVIRRSYINKNTVWVDLDINDDIARELNIFSTLSQRH